MASTLRILQQNIGCSALVAKETICLSIPDEIDLIAVHEPYKNKIGNPFSSFDVITGCQQSEALSAVVVFNEDLEIYKISELCNDRCVCIKIILNNREIIYMVSIFCPADERIENCTRQLQMIFQALDKEKIIICLDASAKSVCWSLCDRTDERGFKLEDFIINNYLCILNRRDPKSYHPDGYSDVTMVTSNLFNQITGWQAMENGVSNGARTIIVELFVGYDIIFETFKNEKKIVRKTKNPRKYEKVKTELDWAMFEDEEIEK